MRGLLIAAALAASSAAVVSTPVFAGCSLENAENNKTAKGGPYRYVSTHCVTMASFELPLAISLDGAGTAWDVGSRTEDRRPRKRR
jgi:hypothetical protein